ncbi:MAG: hypothetical protein IBX64_00775 [Actinobacteria bacterium]|nr:hypothetical protein [Actinomycetota bacterium]
MTSWIIAILRVILGIIAGATLLLLLMPILAVVLLNGQSVRDLFAYGADIACFGAVATIISGSVGGLTAGYIGKQYGWISGFIVGVIGIDRVYYGSARGFGGAGFDFWPAVALSLLLPAEVIGGIIGEGLANREHILHKLRR